jgi:hypothetical protein
VEYLALHTGNTAECPYTLNMIAESLHRGVMQISYDGIPMSLESRASGSSQIREGFGGECTGDQTHLLRYFVRHARQLLPPSVKLACGNKKDTKLIE